MFRDLKYSLLLLLFLTIVSCHKKEGNNVENFLKSISGRPLIPNKIRWDQVMKLSDTQTDSFTNFKTFYFHHDSIYVFKSINTIRNDSIIFAVENVEEFVGKYYINDSIVSFRLKRISFIKPTNDNSNIEVFNDTLKVLKNGSYYCLFHENEQYKVAPKFFKKTFNRYSPFGQFGNSRP